MTPQIRKTIILFLLTSNILTAAILMRSCSKSAQQEKESAELLEKALIQNSDDLREECEVRVQKTKKKPLYQITVHLNPPIVTR